MRRRALGDLVFLPGELLAMAIPFLPFAGDLVPVRILAGERNYNWPAVPLLLLAPFLLGSAMVASTVRQAVAGPLSRGERTAAYALAFAVLAATACVSVDPILGPVIGPTMLLVAVGSLVTLAATMRGRLPAYAHAHAALLVAWIVSMGSATIGTLVDPPPTGGGWWLGVASVPAVALEAVVRVRRALGSGGVAGAEAEEAQRS